MQATITDAVTAEAAAEADGVTGLVVVGTTDLVADGVTDLGISDITYKNSRKINKNYYFTAEKTRLLRKNNYLCQQNSKNMKKIMMLAVMAIVCLTASAQNAEGDITLQPSETLTEIKKMGECTVYAFNYPSVSATGEPTVLSSALFAWTPTERQEIDCIESLHIYCHITITADYECLTSTSTEGMSKEQALLQFLPGRQYTNLIPDDEADYVGRCIVIAPDYEGYGVTKDVPHPYLSQRVTAQQVVDAVQYGLELYQREAAASETLLPMKSDWRSF